MLVKIPGLYLLLVLPFFSLFAQIEPHTLKEEKLNLIITENSAENKTIMNNEVFIEQSGNMNQIEVLQTSRGVSGNLAIINQFGSFEKTILHQTGKDNIIDISQFGYSNDIRIENIANSVSGDINQIGTENTIRLNLNRDQSQFRIIQEGNGHELSNFGPGLNRGGFKIEQRGLSGMKIRISH